MITTALVALAALALDQGLGEPRARHPLVGFGSLADRVEKRLNTPALSDTKRKRWRGVAGVLILLVPFTLLGASLGLLPAPMQFVAAVVVLYLALGHKSLHDHVRPIATALLNGDRERARALTGRIVSRDPETLDIPKAACESVLENGNDSVFGALFWFFVAGIPGVILYRLANTLDAMWGYHNERFEDFGRAAARLDDLLNYIPARLTALSYALMAPMANTGKDGKTFGGWTSIKLAFACWRTQGYLCESPNAGPVMSSGAGALGVTLGGPARYGGQWHERPILGSGPAPEAHDITRALRLVSLAVGLWLATIWVVGVLSGGLAGA